MKRYRPRSILQLILAGFALVALPLAAGLVVSYVQVDRLAGVGRQAVFDAVEVMSASRALIGRITAMERAARQFLVLDDEEVFDTYVERRQRFLADAGALRSRLDPLQASALADLLEHEVRLFDALSSHPPRPDEATALVSRFAHVSALARDIHDRSGERISEEANRMQERADLAKRLALWLLATLLPLALGLAGLCAWIIVRPLRQLYTGITGLGRGKLETPIRVTGSGDLQDLGERLEWLRQRLLSLEQHKSTFLRHVSHELKTPLTSIREGAELLADEVSGALNSEQREIAGILREESVELQKLIEDLLRFNARSAEAGSMTWREVELERLVDEVLDGQKLAIAAKRIAIVRELAPVAMTGDPERLRITFDNLISNAVKFSPAGGELRVRLSVHDATAVIDVRDDGPGIDAGERDRVFEPFFQGRAQPLGHVKGSGLGLAIAREHAEIHNGSVEVVDAPRGAHLRITLPVRPPESRR